MKISNILPFSGNNYDVSFRKPDSRLDESQRQARQQREQALPPGTTMKKFLGGAIKLKKTSRQRDLEADALRISTPRRRSLAEALPGEETGIARPGFTASRSPKVLLENAMHSWVYQLGLDDEESQRRAAFATALVNGHIELIDVEGRNQLRVTVGEDISITGGDRIVLTQMGVTIVQRSATSNSTHSKAGPPSEPSLGVRPKGAVSNAAGSQKDGVKPATTNQKGPSSAAQDFIPLQTLGAGPGPGASAIRNAGNAVAPARLQETAYRQALQEWVLKAASSDDEFSSRQAVAGKIQNRLASAKNFTLNLSQIPNLSSPPPMPLSGTKVKVAEGQFKNDALADLAGTGVEVIVVPSAVAEERTADTAGSKVAASEPASPLALPETSMQRMPKKLAGKTGLKPRDFAYSADVPSTPPIIESLQSTSKKPPSFEKRLDAWVSQNPAEKDVRRSASDKILIWLAKNRFSQQVSNSTRRRKPVQPLDLSSAGELKFSSMPPLPEFVKDVIVANQNLREVDIHKLPPDLKSLDLKGNPLKDIHDEELPDSFKDLQIDLGITTLPPRVVRRLNIEGRWPAYKVSLPASSGQHAKADTYHESWREIMPVYQAYINAEEADKFNRMEAIRRLDEWVHKDNGEISETPLNFRNLGLSELPSVWPHDVTIKSIDAKGNRLQEVPLSTLPPGLNYLDLRKNPIDRMPLELTKEQMQARGNRRFKTMATSPTALASEMERHGFKLTDPRIVDPREREGLTIILHGTPLLEKTGKQYEARENGPAYVFSERALQELEKDLQNSPGASLFKDK